MTPGKQPGPRQAEDLEDDRRRDDQPDSSRSIGQEGGAKRSPRRSASRPARSVTSQPVAPSDSPAAVAAAVARILDGGPVAEEVGVPGRLLPLYRTRSAARRILEAHLELEDEQALLGALVKRTYDLDLGDWARDLLLLELAGPEDIETADHRWLVAQERLNRAYFTACPLCMTPVRDEKALQRLRSRDEAAQAARARWEEVASW
jgi:hypothetical protein